MMFHSKIDSLRCSSLACGLALLLVGAALAAEYVDTRSTAEIKRDLRATEWEFDELQDLRSGLDRSSRQSANTARSSAIGKLESFMTEAVKRRERDLGSEMTLKQQGEPVRTGTTEVAEVGSPVPTNRRNGGRSLFDTTDGNRLNLLLNMQTLQASAQNIFRSAIEGQKQAFAQYSEVAGSFSLQLSSAIGAMKAELARREDPAAAADSVSGGR